MSPLQDFKTYTLAYLFVNLDDELGERLGDLVQKLNLLSPSDVERVDDGLGHNLAIHGTISNPLAWVKLTLPCLTRNFWHQSGTKVRLGT